MITINPIHFAHTAVEELVRVTSNVSQMTQILSIFRSIFQVSHHYSGKKGAIPFKHTEEIFLNASSACACIHSIHHITSEKFIKKIKKRAFLDVTQAIIGVIQSVKMTIEWFQEQKTTSITLKILENSYVSFLLTCSSGLIFLYQNVQKIYKKGIDKTKLVITQLFLQTANISITVTLSRVLGSSHISLVITHAAFTAIDLGIDIACSIYASKDRERSLKQT